MCGIAGLVGEFDRDGGIVAIGRMLDALERRGPDGSGIETWSGAILGHRRLAIIDLSDAGRQPMTLESGAVGVTFNGEIYNFRDLRAELTGYGYRFRSTTDTEVILHGYSEWGIDGLVSRLRGMFAFAVWDDHLKKLFLARDRLGVKPLVYAASDGKLGFASTARALRVGGFASDIDEAAVVEYLHFGFITDQRSIYREVSKVPAASIVEWSGGEISTRGYWQVPGVSSAPITFEESVEQAEEALLGAVKVRLYADVPVGALLSGGVDSSLVCWAIAKLGGDVTAYTVGAPGDPWDETKDAAATASVLKIKHEVVAISAGDAPDASELVSAFGEPFACTSALGMLRVSEAIKGSAKVLLTGDGGDDVFLGYEGHQHFSTATRLARALPGEAAEWWLAARDHFPRAGVLRRAASFMDYVAGGIGGVTRARDGFQLYRRAGALGERIAGASVAQLEIPLSPASGQNLLADFLNYDRRNRFEGEYLPKVDGATMHHSIEARSPFLDQKLWEFAARLPFDVRLHKGRLKAILRELARGRKRGFQIPVQRWITNRWRAEVEESLRDGLLEREGWLRARPLIEELDRAARDGFAPNQLWYAYMLERWLRRERAEQVAAMGIEEPLALISV
jgi:asparagine synthase (glutamine-hydrolysing)